MAVPSPSLRPLSLLLLISSTSSALLSPPGGVNDEVQALVSMKNLLEDPQGVLTNWDPESVDPCTWTLVACSTQKLVSRLEAQSQNLSGRLSPSIGNLTKSQVSNNNITGTIPAEIGKLRGLKELDLSSNHFYGEIPSSVAHLESLRYLDLSYNNLSGPIPRSFAGTLYVVRDPLICGENTGQGCSTTVPVPTSNHPKISKASLPTAKTKSHKFVVPFGSTIACIIFLLFPIS